MQNDSFSTFDRDGAADYWSIDNLNDDHPAKLAARRPLLVDLRVRHILPPAPAHLPGILREVISASRVRSLACACGSVSFSPVHAGARLISLPVVVRYV